MVAETIIKYVYCKCGSTKASYFKQHPLRPIPMSGPWCPDCDNIREEIDVEAEIRNKLKQDSEEAVLYEEKEPTEFATEECIRIAKKFSSFIDLHTLKWGAFTDDSGGINLVFQSLVPDRRISYCIPPNFGDIIVINIDGCMEAKTTWIRPLGEE